MLFFRNIQKVHFKENTKKISYNFCLDKKVDQIKIKTNIKPNSDL